MSSEDFLQLCEEKIAAYLNVPVGTEYEIYTIWKDYWTEGATMDAVPSENNQKGIFGTTYNTKTFTCTYNGIANKLYMDVSDVEDSEVYDLTPSNNSSNEENQEGDGDGVITPD